jgi:hypothetical protein
VPGLAFATNFLWVIVIGLLGPSMPAIVEDLGISCALWLAAALALVGFM